MAKVKYDLTGKDAVFLANCVVYEKGLASLALYQSRPEKVPSQEEINEGINWYKQSFEAGKNGDRIHISIRNEARKRITDKFEKTAQFLSSVAGEDDLPALMQAGLQLVVPRKRSARRAPVVQQTVQPTTLEQGAVVTNQGGLPRN